MTEKRYDGAKLLAGLTGVPRQEVLEIWEWVKENRRKLLSCDRHRFEGSVEVGKSFICLNCGGEMRSSDLYPYLRGYKAAGGDPRDIWNLWTDDEPRG